MDNTGSNAGTHNTPHTSEYRITKSKIESTGPLQLTFSVLKLPTSDIPQAAIVQQNKSVHQAASFTLPGVINIQPAESVHPATIFTGFLQDSVKQKEQQKILTKHRSPIHRSPLTVQLSQTLDGKVKKVTAPNVQKRQLIEQYKTYFTTFPQDLTLVTKSVTSQQPKAIVAQQSSVPVNFPLHSFQNTTDFNKNAFISKVEMFREHMRQSSLNRMSYSPLNQHTTHSPSNTVESENEYELRCPVYAETIFDGKVKKVTAPNVQKRQLIEQYKTFTTWPQDLTLVTKSVTSQQPKAIVAQQSSVPVNFQLHSFPNTTDFTNSFASNVEMFREHMRQSSLNRMSYSQLNQHTTHSPSNTVESENEYELRCPGVYAETIFDGKVKKVTAPNVQKRQLIEQYKTFTTWPQDLTLVTKSVASQQPKAIVAQQSSVPVNFQLHSFPNTTDFTNSFASNVEMFREHMRQSSLNRMSYSQLNQHTTHSPSNTVESENEYELRCPGVYAETIFDGKVKKVTAPNVQKRQLIEQYKTFTTWPQDLTLVTKSVASQQPKAIVAQQSSVPVNFQLHSFPNTTDFTNSFASNVEMFREHMRQSSLNRMSYSQLNQHTTHSPSNTVESEDELRCPICAEMFIEAMTLSCSHTFCKYCLMQWQKNGLSCPMCKVTISKAYPTRAINNYIEKILENASQEVKENRRQEIAQRRAATRGEEASSEFPIGTGTSNRFFS